LKVGSTSGGSEISCNIWPFGDADFNESIKFLSELVAANEIYKKYV
jgi:hypothetical protein